MQPGDTIKVFTKDEQFEGTYLEKPSLLGTDTIILKLNNGYNVGIAKDKITSMKVIKEYEPKKEKKKELPFDPKKKTVSILSLGGTISSKVDYTTGGVIAAYSATDFVEMCPELAEIANIKAKKVMGIMSEDMRVTHWGEIVSAIQAELKEADGVVITMGTDTLHYTSAAVSFALHPTKPIIFTAAQRSIDRPSSDAFFNLICAVRAAADWKGTGVVTCMHGSSSDDTCLLLRATKVKKLHSSKRDAFKPINQEPLAKVTPQKVEEIEQARRNAKEEVHNHFSSKVALVMVHPGITPAFIKSLDHYKGIILIGTGLGHIPENIYEEVKKLVEKEIFVGMTTQCLFGATSATVYSPLRRISMSVGVTYLGDMLAETAFVKLCWALGKTENAKEVKQLMITNLVGEYNDRLDLLEEN